MANPSANLIKQLQGFVSRGRLVLDRAESTALQKLVEQVTQHETAQAAELDRSRTELDEFRVRLTSAAEQASKLEQRISALGAENQGLRQSGQALQQRLTAAEKAEREREALLSDVEHLRSLPGVGHLLDEARRVALEEGRQPLAELQAALQQAETRAQTAEQKLTDRQSLSRNEVVRQLVAETKKQAQDQARRDHDALLADAEWLRVHPTVSSLLKEARKSAVDEGNTTIAALTQDLTEARGALTTARVTLQDADALRQNPTVQGLIEARISEVSQLSEERARLLKEKAEQLMRVATELEAARAQGGGPPPSAVRRDVFQRLIADTVSGLQGTLVARSETARGTNARESGGFVIDEVEVSTAAIVEEHEGQPVFVLPTRADLKELKVDGLSRLRFKMLQVPE